MPIFSYKAKDAKSKLVEGVVEAVSEEAVANLLLEKDLTIINIDLKNSIGFSAGSLNFFKRVKTKDLVIFFRQLSVMIEAQLPVVRALRLLAKQTENEKLRLVVAGITDEVDGGAKLSAAMKSFPDIFSNFYINVVLSGETSGRLSEVMNYLADQQEKDYDLQSKIKGAMIYPAFILGGLVVVGFLMMTFVVPQMTSMLLESGVKLPFMTRVLIGTADFFKNFWWQMILFFIFVFLAVRFYISTPAGRRALDSFKLRAPIFGSILKKVYIVRITRSLNTLLAGGVPATKALATVREVVDNQLYRELLDQTIKDVDEGGAIADSFAASDVMPPMVSQMAAIGEETGRLSDVLDRVTDFYSREIDNSVQNLSTLIEPIVMVFLGIGVGAFIAAVLLPMWQLSAAM